ncbi:MAG: Holliday junction resolvase RuvX [Minisyncoccia bacterium]
MASILAVDYGTKRLGLAIADEHLKLPLLLKPIEYSQNNIDAVFEKIKKICEENNVSLIILGLPLSFNFQETPICQKIKKFGELLEKNTQRKVIYQNEVLTTDEAIKIQENITGQRKRKYHSGSNLDSQSAALILESYFISKKAIN